MKLKKIIAEVMFRPSIPGFVFIAFILLAIGVTWCAVANGRQAREANLFAAHAIGDTVRANDVSLVVEKVRRDNQGTGPLTPRPGHEFIIPTIIVKNNGETPFEFIPLLSLYVKDASGNVYPETAVVSDGGVLSGPILPHDVLREEVGFEVPMGAAGLVLYFEVNGAERKIIAVRLESSSFWRSVLDILSTR